MYDKIFVAVHKCLQPVAVMHDVHKKVLHVQYLSSLQVRHNSSERALSYKTPHFKDCGTFCGAKA